jgi:hypothetical protein
MSGELLETSIFENDIVWRKNTFHVAIGDSAQRKEIIISLVAVLYRAPRQKLFFSKNPAVKLNNGLCVLHSA